jgi:hypothetical protein
MTRCPPRQTLVLLSQCLAASDAALSSGDMAKLAHISRGYAKAGMAHLASLGAARRVPADDPRRPAGRHGLEAHWTRTELTLQPLADSTSAPLPRERGLVSDDAVCTVFDALLDGPASVTVLTEITCLSHETLRKALLAMYGRGEVEVLDVHDARRPPLGPHHRVWAVVRCAPAAKAPVATAGVQP